MTYPTIHGMLREWEQPMSRTSLPIPPDIIAWLETNAPKQFKEFQSSGRSSLYRGFNGGRFLNNGESILVPAMMTYRPARNIGDLYEVMCDHSNPMYPRRGYSTICSTGLRGAEDYGTPYHVFPPDDQTVGLVNMRDMHDTGILSTTGTITNFIQRVALLIKDKSEGDPVHLRGKEELMRFAYSGSRVGTDVEELDHLFEQFIVDILAWMVRMTPEVNTAQFIRNLEGFDGLEFDEWMTSRLRDKSKVSFSDWALQSGAFKYEKFGCSTDAAGLMGVTERSNECWFEGPYVAIPYDYYRPLS